MKTTLPVKSKSHEERINQIKDIILAAGKDSIAFIILFGSFARGTWVLDVKKEEDGNIYEYASDYDFLIITRTVGQSNPKSLFILEKKIDEELKLKGLLYKQQNHTPHYIFEPIKRVNAALEDGQYFFSDIKKEGILLYNSGEFEFSEPKEMNEKRRRGIARKEYEHWFESALGFLRDSKNTFKIKDYKKSAFYLHQATECFYSATLLTITGYKPKTHDLKELGHFCSIQSNDFLTIFPTTTEAQKENFELLRKAYIDARYNKEYVITKEQLEYLITRVEKLKKLVEEVCKTEI